MNLAAQATGELLMGRLRRGVARARRCLGGGQASLDDEMRTWMALVAGDGGHEVRHALAMARDDELNAPFAYLRAAVGAALAGDAASARAAADELRALRIAGVGRSRHAWPARRPSRCVLEGSRDAGLAVGREALELPAVGGHPPRRGPRPARRSVSRSATRSQVRPSSSGLARGFDDIGAKAVVTMVDAQRRRPGQPRDTWRSVTAWQRARPRRRSCRADGRGRGRRRTGGPGSGPRPDRGRPGLRGRPAAPVRGDPAGPAPPTRGAPGRAGPRRDPRLPARHPRTSARPTGRSPRRRPTSTTGGSRSPVRPSRR